MSTQTVNPIDSKELYAEYNWYRNTFPPVVQKCCDEFFLPGFKFSMIGISKNVNPLMDKDSYFVTKIRIDKQYDMFFRSSEKAISLILDRVLGKPNRSFNLNRMTDLEAKIITSFNDYMFNVASALLNPPPPNELRRTNFDVIHLTFVIRDVDEPRFGKFIVSLPAALLKPDAVVSKGPKFDNTSFKTSTLDVNIKIGSTRFTMMDLKNLDVEDIVVFDNSNTKHMTLVIDDYVKDIKLNPNLGLITPVENNGGDNMAHFEIRDLSFSYPAAKGRLALNKINLNIQRGEYLTVCGKSGSGNPEVKEVAVSDLSVALGLKVPFGKCKKASKYCSNKAAEAQELEAEVMHEVVDNIFSQRKNIVKRPIKNQA